jgi:hypothetical protein
MKKIFLLFIILSGVLFYSDPADAYYSSWGWGFCLEHEQPGGAWWCDEPWLFFGSAGTDGVGPTCSSGSVAGQVYGIEGGGLVGFYCTVVDPAPFYIEVGSGSCFEYDHCDGNGGSGCYFCDEGSWNMSGYAGSGPSCTTGLVADLEYSPVTSKLIGFKCALTPPTLNFSSSKLTIGLGESFTLSYDVTGATLCEASVTPGGGDWSGLKAEYPDGSYEYSDIKPDTTGIKNYKLSCSNSAGTITEIVSVDVTNEIYDCLPKEAVCNIASCGQVLPGICMSNLAVIDPTKISCGGCADVSCDSCPSIPSVPPVPSASTSYNGSWKEIIP